MDYIEAKPGKSLVRQELKERIQAKVSIITPYYNAGKYITETYNSVINQTFPWFEWIIVDDGSDDEKSLNALDELATRDARISVIHKKNGGLASARNYGFQNATTDLVVPLDADDLLSPTYIDYLYWALRYNPDAAWAYTDSIGFQGQEYVWKKKFDAAKMKEENILVATAMIRKSAFDLIGGYKVEKCSYNEDWRFWLELLSKHQFPVHVNANLFWYRRQNDTMLSDVKNDSEKKALNKKIIDKAKKTVDVGVEAVEYPIANRLYKAYYGRQEYRKWDELPNVDSNKVILWIIPWMSLGGADKFNYDAINGLNKKGYKNIIITTKESPNEWLERFQKETDEIYTLPDFISVKYYPEFISYIIQTRKVNYVIVSNSAEGYASIPFIRHHFPNVPIIDYVHMEEWYWREGGYARSSGDFAGILDETLVCNSATRKVMIENFGSIPEETHCLHIGVDDDYYSSEKEKAGYLREKLGIEESKKIVLFPCRICEQKRPFLLLDIAEYVKRNSDNIIFVVVGNGPDYKELLNKIKMRKLSDVVYTIGVCDEMRKCYKDSDLLLICSRQEGLTLTTYEACSMGIPVVSSNVGGQRDLISSDNGCLIEVPIDEQKGISRWSLKEVEEFGNAIINILSDDIKKVHMGENGRNAILQKYSIKKMIEKLDCILKNVEENPILSDRRRLQSAAFNSMPNFTSEYYAVNCRWETEERKGGQQLIGMVYNWVVKIPILGKIILAPFRFAKKIILK